MKRQLPDFIYASRRGVGEGVHESTGELAPITWECRCGRRLTLESWKYNPEDREYQYFPIPETCKEEFLIEHSNCGEKHIECARCNTVPVDRYRDLCDPCAHDAEEERWTALYAKWAKEDQAKAEAEKVKAEAEAYEKARAEAWAAYVASPDSYW